MAKKRGRKPLRDRVTQRAKEEAALRYAPQRRQLTAQQQAIADQFAAGAKAETATAQGISSSIDAVKPKVQGYIGTAQGISDQASQDLATYLGGAGSPLQGAAARDNAGTRRRLAEMLAGATTELDQRKVDAQAGAKYTIGSLRSAAAKELEKVGGQLSDLASDEGVYASTVVNKTREAQRQRAVTKRGQDLSHEDRVADRESRETLARERAADRGSSSGSTRLPGGVKMAPPATQRSAVNKIEQARTDIRKMLANPTLKKKYPQMVSSSERVRRAFIADSLSGLSEYKSQPAYLSAALDIELAGHLGRTTTQRLHQLGIEVEKLRVPTYGSTRRRSSRPSVAAGLRGAGRAIRGA
jgi:hypothetical protein